MTDLRAFTYGIMVGIVILIGSFALVSYMAGLKWQPVRIGALPFGCEKTYVNSRGEDTGECS